MYLNFKSKCVKICKIKKSYFIQGIMKRAYFQSEFINLHSIKLSIFIKILIVINV